MTFLEEHGVETYLHARIPHYIPKEHYDHNLVPNTHGIRCSRCGKQARRILPNEEARLRNTWCTGESQ